MCVCVDACAACKRISDPHITTRLELGEAAQARESRCAQPPARGALQRGFCDSPAADAPPARRAPLVISNHPASKNPSFVRTRPHPPPTHPPARSLKYQTRCIAAHSRGYALGSVEGRVAMEVFDPSPEAQRGKYAFKVGAP
jgi:hypothetical protein